MIRTIVLVGLLAVIFYCAVAGAARAKATPLAQARLQFIPGMAALHAAAPAVATTLRVVARDPNA